MHSKTDQQTRLLRYWTLKEAFVKATGLGLTLGVQQYIFDLEAHPHPTMSILSPADSQVSDWQFRQYTLPTGHILALAHQQPDAQNIIVTVKEATWLHEIAELG
jgi:4'-phosphopantetheinyl transferase